MADEIEYLGVVLAGGTGSRLDPVTRYINKHLLPVFDKPMIYYPVAQLMSLGMRRLVVVTGPDAMSDFETWLGDGSDWGVEICLVEQARPDGVAGALLAAAEQARGRQLVVALGDNLFTGDWQIAVRPALVENPGVTVFWQWVPLAAACGVIRFDAGGRPMELVEKPAEVGAGQGVAGWYVYDDGAIDRIAGLLPSPRGELEITDLNRSYLEQGRLRAMPLPETVGWYDAGTAAGWLQAAHAIAAWQQSTGRLIACPEEIAWRQRWIDERQLSRLTAKARGPYQVYLQALTGKDA